MQDQETVDLTIIEHQKKYTDLPISVAYAPGRIEVLGNHTDYNNGVTLSAAINLGVCFTISPSKKKGVHVYSVDFNDHVSFNSSEKKIFKNKHKWANYIKGVIFYISKLGIKIDYINCTFKGSIPIGSGLSSSAALEVATSFAILEYYDQNLDLIELSKIAQKAEMEFAGCNCGLLDQFSSIFGSKNGLIFSDFQSLSTKTIPIHKDAVFILCNPNIAHELSSSPYNARRKCCENAVIKFSELIDKPIKSLRDVTWNEYELYHNKINFEDAKCAEHIIGEIYRVNRSIKLLEKDNLVEFGNLLYESHKSSQINFRNSCKELDEIISISHKLNALGARLSGGGWGGSAIVLTKKNIAENLATKIIQECKNKNIYVKTNLIIPSQGARTLQI